MKIKKSSKEVLLALVVCLALLLIFPQAVFAADGVRLSASSEDGLSGGEVTVTISIENASGTEGGEFELNFDPAVAIPVSISKGSFFDDVQQEDFMSNFEYDDDTLKIVWTTVYGDTDDSGVVCAIDFELVGEGDTSLTFSGVVFAPSSIDVDTTHSAGSINVDDEEEARQKAIDAANAAIAALPDPTEITLADKPDVEAARALVDAAKSDHDAEDDDFEDLGKLVETEEMIAKLEAIKAADDAIAALPSVENLTLDDKPAVVAARALVNKAKDDHGAVDDDFNNLATLRAAENRIKELEGLVPTPPTGTAGYVASAGLLLIALGFMVYFKRKSLLNEK